MAGAMALRSEQRGQKVGQPLSHWPLPSQGPRQCCPGRSRRDKLRTPLGKPKGHSILSPPPLLHTTDGP